MNRNTLIRLVIRSTYSTFSIRLWYMLRILDGAPLRSFVAVADCGGFQRAANSLHLSQGAVSQHVRRLEAAVGRPLVERQGRGSRFTPDGDTLLRPGRRLLAWPARSRTRSLVAVCGSASTAACSCVRRWLTAGSMLRCC